MPRRKSSVIKERHHIHLSHGAWDRLAELYRPQGITPSHVIAQLVDFHLKRIEEKANLRMRQEDYLRSQNQFNDEVEIVP